MQIIIYLLLMAWFLAYPIVGFINAVYFLIKILKNSNQRYYKYYVFFILLMILWIINIYSYLSGYWAAMYNGCGVLLCIEWICEYPQCYNSDFYKIYKDTFLFQLVLSYILFLGLIIKYFYNLNSELWKKSDG